MLIKKKDLIWYIALQNNTTERKIITKLYGSILCLNCIPILHGDYYIEYI